ncbi:MAG: [protein-PII] uridylyltransferase [Robiginitomaculum sp.]|nr:[protein-PII] uridylyltransferase [Robiginitomaculum sp.]
MTLLDQLTVIGDDKAKTLAVLKKHLAANTQKILSAFEAGKVSALDTAAATAQAHDEILIALFDHAAKNLFSGADQMVSLCAVGGYGRGEMAPFSDLDLLFLTSPKSDERICAQITEYILYMLWDMGLKVGHATRSPAQCIELGRKDETVLTAMLDLRLLAGAEEPATKLVGLLAKERNRARKRRYIAVKLTARDNRHEREGNSRYVIEPNVKEGKGGLRDLHELYWISLFIYGGKRKEAPVNPHGVTAYMQLGLLNRKAAIRFSESAEFLWATRIHLHRLGGRATEILSFDKQAELAKRMGALGSTPEERVGTFMHAYFNTTREVGALTRIACAKLEAESQLLLPQGLDRFLPTSRRGLKEPGFVLEHGRLNFTAAARLKTRPILTLHLFRIAGARNLDIHPNAFQALFANRHRIDDSFRQDPDIAQVFYKILLESKAPAAILRTMNEAGILGAYLPEFGEIVGRTQFNMHHAYTVDEHTISLVQFLHDIESGECEREHPLASSFIKDWNTRTRLLVYLACLFHDVGKAEGDQCEDGARLTTEAGLRLGLPDADIETISWLVRNHLSMSETAQRRDITDADTVEAFARTVGSLKRLQMLTVLTVVDIRAVGPGIWNDWKGELLRQLYFGARKILMGMGTDEDSAENEQDEILARLSKKAKQKTHFIRTKLDRPKDITELWVLTQDRAHLFADLAGAIALCGASIIGAKLHTSGDGRVFNRFYLQNTEGLAFGRKNERRLRDLEGKTLLAAKGDLDIKTVSPGSTSSRAQAIPVHPRVSILQKDERESIIEVEGRDRPGLLHALALVLASHKLSVRSAHIEVIGPKAIDVFYVTLTPDSPPDENSLRTDLLAVFAKQE